MTQNAPEPVRIETKRFLLRSLLPSDASDKFAAWSADPEVMEPLNLMPQQRTSEDMAAYIADFDNFHRYLVGVFTNGEAEHIGFVVVRLDRMQLTVSFNSIIGDKKFWGKKVVLETRAALLDHFFEHHGMEKATGTPIARNFPAIFNYKAQAWRLEGILKGHVRAADGRGRVDQYQYGLLRDEWRAMREAEQAQ